MLTKFLNENQVWCYLWEARKESHTFIEWYIVFSYGYIWGSSVRYGMFSTFSYPTKRHWIFGGITEYFTQSWFIIRGRNSLPRKLWFFLFLISILAKEVEFHGICSKFRSENSAKTSECHCWTYCGNVFLKYDENVMSIDLPCRLTYWKLFHPSWVWLCIFPCYRRLFLLLQDISHWWSLSSHKKIMI